MGREAEREEKTALIRETVRELLPELVKAVTAAVDAQREEFWVPAPEHYLDHEMMKACRAENDRRRRNADFVEKVKARESEFWDNMDLGTGIRNNMGSTGRAVGNAVAIMLAGGLLVWMGNQAIRWLLDLLIKRQVGGS